MVRQSLELLATWIDMIKIADFIFDDHDFSLLKGTAAQCVHIMHALELISGDLIKEVLSKGC